MGKQRWVSPAHLLPEAIASIEPALIPRTALHQTGDDLGWKVLSLPRSCFASSMEVMLSQAFGIMKLDAESCTWKLSHWFQRRKQDSRHGRVLLNTMHGDSLHAHHQTAYSTKESGVQGNGVLYSFCTQIIYNYSKIVSLMGRNNYSFIHSFIPHLSINVVSRVVCYIKKQPRSLWVMGQVFLQTSPDSEYQAAGKEFRLRQGWGRKVPCSCSVFQMMVGFSPYTLQQA